MDQFVAAIGWYFLVSLALATLAVGVLFVGRLFKSASPPRIIGAELPIVDAGIDLSKRFDIVYGAGHGAATEMLAGVRILGYMRSHRDQTGDEYVNSGWLVVELSDHRRAYLRPRAVLWLLESEQKSPTNAG